MASSQTSSMILRVRQTVGAHRPRRIPLEGRAPAGVLLLFYDIAGQTHLLFTKRTELVEHHKGQISFPGGAEEPSDPDLLHTALRETFEEVGVMPEDVELVGQLNDIVSRMSHFVISPYVGIITASVPYPFKPAHHEVEEILEVPLAHLLDDANVIREMRSLEGEEVEVSSYRFGKHIIWGATARILRQLLALLSSPREASEG
jgi:8-oxo-dGTP pyrophosphatase MutT (NUDIX family)